MLADGLVTALLGGLLVPNGPATALGRRHPLWDLLFFTGFRLLTTE